MEQGGSVEASKLPPFYTDIELAARYGWSLREVMEMPVVVKQAVLKYTNIADAVERLKEREASSATSY